MPGFNVEGKEEYCYGATAINYVYMDDLIYYSMRKWSKYNELNLVEKQWESSGCKDITIRRF